jgi:SAM-dependent methyltransferase
MNKLNYIFEILNKRGFVFIWKYFLESKLFDIIHGTQTSSRVPKEQQKIDGIYENEQSNGLLYVASFSSVTKETVNCAVEVLGESAFSEAQFLDLGCGKGKALLVFAKFFGVNQQFPAIGIEYDPNLVSVAQSNLQKCGFARGRVKVVADSALNLLTYVSSETLVVYLYNSFQGETLRAVLNILCEIPHVLIYVDPAEKFRLDDYGYKIIRQHRGRYNANTWLVASSGL